MPLADNLVAYWKMDEASGNRADSFGANTLVDNGSTLSAAGILSNAASFVSASSQFLSIVDNAALSVGGTSFSICAWVYLTNLAPTRRVLMKAVSDAARDYMLEVDSSGWQFGIGNGVSAQQNVTGTLPLVTANAWHFVVGWYDVVASTINVQADNGPVYTLATVVVPVDSAGPLNISRNVSGGEFLDGRVDNVMFFKRVLTDDDRRLLYNSGLGLVYPFPSTTNTQVYLYAGADAPADVVLSDPTTARSNSYNDTLTLDRIMGWAGETGLDALAALSLARGESWAGQAGLDALAALSLGRTLDVLADSLQQQVGSLRMSRHVDQSPIFDYLLDLSGPLTLDRTESLAASDTLGLVAALVAARGESATPADVLDMSGSVGLGRSDGLSGGGGIDLAGLFTLARTEGYANVAGLDLLSALALARTLGISDNAVLDAVSALSLAKTLGLSPGDTLDLLASVGLGRSDGLSGGGGLDSTNLLALARGEGLTPTGALDLPGALTLGEARGLANAGGLDMLAVLTLAETLGFAAALIIAILLKQSSFRFYNDDGSESTETPVAGESVNASIALGTNIIIRIQVDSRGEPLASQFQLEYRRSGSSDPWQVVS